MEENFHLWLSFTPVNKVENFAIFWYIAIFTKNIKFRWKTQIIEFFEKMLFGMILFLNGNKKRKNRRKLPFVIELHSGSQSGEFRNFLVHCNLQKKHKISLKNSNYWVFWKMLFGMILFLNGNKKRKNRRKLPFVIEVHSGSQSGEFRNFWYIAIFTKNIKFRWKTQIIEFFEKMLFGMILFLNGNKKRKNRRKLPFVIELHSGSQSGEFRNFLVHCNLQKNT